MKIDVGVFFQFFCFRYKIIAAYNIITKIYCTKFYDAKINNTIEVKKLKL